MNRLIKFLPVLGLIVFLGGILLLSSSGEFRNPRYWTVCGLGTLLFLTVFLQGSNKNISGFVFNLLTVIFFGGTLVCVFEIAQNRKMEWDVTQGKVNSLSKESIGYLRTLQTPIQGK